MFGIGGKPKIPESDFREILSKWVSLVSIAGVIVIAVAIITFGFLNKESSTMTNTFSAVLPLFGAWIGTILAFYFGKENFETATRSVTSIAKVVGPLEKLREIPVTSKMIARKDMKEIDDLAPDKIKLTDIFAKMEDKERLPILVNDEVVYIIHRSAIDRYLAQKALNAPSAPLKDLTLKNLLDEDQDLKRMFEHSFAIVKEDATLADAKIAMEGNVQKCQDVFVTKDGKVTGWITNNKIQEAARL
jgi:predicted transcriptional regulator